MYDSLIYLINQFLNDIPHSTEALKVAIQNPSIKSLAIKQLAEMNELVDSQAAALEMFQYAVDQEDSDPQTWKVFNLFSLF